MILYCANNALKGNFYGAQDIAQDCMMKLAEKEIFEDIMNMKEDKRRRYLASMVSNCSIDFIRKEKRYVLQSTDEVNTYFENEECNNDKKIDPYKKVALRMELLDIINSIKSLSDKDKWIFKCLLCYDMKIKDIARMCNITISGVHKRLFRARVQLKEDRLAWQG